MDELTASLAGAPAALLHLPGSQSRERGGRGRGRGRGRGSGDSNNMSPRPRLQRPKVQMMPRALCDILDEPKIALMHRVVNIAGADIAWKALMETMTIEDHGGLSVNADACGKPAHMLQSTLGTTDAQPRRRTKGGVFLTMLKTHVPKDVYKKIFEVEATLKKKRKKQMRHVRHQKMESQINALPLDELFIGAGKPWPLHRVGSEEEGGEEGEIDEHDVAMADDRASSTTQRTTPSFEP